MTKRDCCTAVFRTTAPGPDKLPSCNTRGVRAWVRASSKVCFGLGAVCDQTCVESAMRTITRGVLRHIESVYTEICSVVPESVRFWVLKNRHLLDRPQLGGHTSNELVPSTEFRNSLVSCPQR